MLGILRTFKRIWLGDRRLFAPQPLLETEVLAFESCHRVRLPEEYRHYLLTVAGAPPGFARSYLLHESMEDIEERSGFLARDFPYLEHWNEPDSPDYNDDRHINGSLLLADEGCGHFARLVVTGPMRGTVWEDSRGCDWGVGPLRDRFGEPLTFMGWVAARNHF